MSQELPANHQRSGKACARGDFTTACDHQADLAQRIAPMRVVGATGCTNTDELPIFWCLQSPHARNREPVIHIVN
jgi:hypothetical protein